MSDVKYNTTNYERTPYAELKPKFGNELIGFNSVVKEYVVIVSLGFPTSFYSDNEVPIFNATTPPSDSPTITYGKDKFVSAFDSVFYNVPHYSTDGITWASGNTTNPILVVDYDEKNEIFVASIGGGALIESYDFYYSTDGITWVGLKLPPAGITASRVIVDNNLGITYVFGANNRIYYSYDVRTGFTDIGLSINAFNNNPILVRSQAQEKTIIIQKHGADNYISDDGINFTSIANPMTGLLTNYRRGTYHASSGKVFVTDSTDYIYYSDDLMNWTEVSVPSINAPYRLKFLPKSNKLMVVQYDLGSNLGLSDDGINWDFYYLDNPSSGEALIDFAVKTYFT